MELNDDMIKMRMDILEKAIKLYPNDMNLTHEMNELIKGRKAQVGEIRVWDGQKMQKQGDGSWAPVKENRKPWYVEQNEHEQAEKSKNAELANKIKDELINLFKNKEPVKVSGGLSRIDDPSENFKNLDVKVHDENLGTKKTRVSFNYRGKDMAFSLRRFSDDIELEFSSVSHTVGKKNNFKEAIRNAINYVDRIPENRL